MIPIDLRFTYELWSGVGGFHVKEPRYCTGDQGRSHAIPGTSQGNRIPKNDETEGF